MIASDGMILTSRSPIARRTQPCFAAGVAVTRERATVFHSSPVSESGVLVALVPTSLASAMYTAGRHRVLAGAAMISESFPSWWT
jgi:hypothetical protein